MNKRPWRTCSAALALSCALTSWACGDSSGTSASEGSEGASESTSESSSESGSTSASGSGTTSGSGSASSTGTVDSATSSAGPTSGATTDDASTTGSGQACPDLGDACTQCEASMCAEEYCNCFNNGSCALLSQCGAMCPIGDIDCYQECWTQYPEGISDAALLTHCAATTCSGACPPYMPLSPCQECLYTECQDEMNVCVSNPACTQLLYCIDDCDDPGCENLCYTQYPDGLADSGPVATCLQEQCAEACS